MSTWPGEENLTITQLHNPFTFIFAVLEGNALSFDCRNCGFFFRKPLYLRTLEDHECIKNVQTKFSVPKVLQTRIKLQRELAQAKCLEKLRALTPVLPASYTERCTVLDHDGFRCNYCGDAFTSQKTLGQHIRRRAEAGGKDGHPKDHRLLSLTCHGQCETALKLVVLKTSGLTVRRTYRFLRANKLDDKFNASMQLSRLNAVRGRRRHQQGPILNASASSEFNMQIFTHALRIQRQTLSPECLIPTPFPRKVITPLNINVKHYTGMTWEYRPQVLTPNLLEPFSRRIQSFQEPLANLVHYNLSWFTAAHFKTLTWDIAEKHDSPYSGLLPLERSRAGTIVDAYVHLRKRHRLNPVILKTVQTYSRHGYTFITHWIREHTEEAQHICTKALHCTMQAHLQHCDWHVTFLVGIICKMASERDIRVASAFVRDVLGFAGVEVYVNERSNIVSAIKLPKADYSENFVTGVIWVLRVWITYAHALGSTGLSGEGLSKHCSGLMLQALAAEKQTLKEWVTKTKVQMKTVEGFSQRTGGPMVGICVFGKNDILFTKFGLLSIEAQEQFVSKIHSFIDRIVQKDAYGIPRREHGTVAAKLKYVYTHMTSEPTREY